LLDAELLAEVYLAMTRGQTALVNRFHAGGCGRPLDDEPGGALELVVSAGGREELAAHEQYLAELDKASAGPASGASWRARRPTVAVPQHGLCPSGRAGTAVPIPKNRVYPIFDR